MANKDEGTFFDVLIDRLVADVRREFEAGLHETPQDAAYEAPKKPTPVVAFDDLVSKMVGFRARMAAPTAQPQAYAPRFLTGDVKNQMSTATPKMAKPRFESSEAEIAYTLALKSGAKFMDGDLDDSTLTPEALKRERRRVLLTLHPDRVPEADRARAHEAFLTAAEAFTTLAEACAAQSRPYAA